METDRPPFRADHVGSLLRPEKLMQAQSAFAKGAISEAVLKDVREESIREAVKRQEDLGLKSITDGEFNRIAWQSDFLSRFDNAEIVPSKITIAFHTAEGSIPGKPPSLAVTGKLSRPEKGIFVEDFAFLKTVTKETPKITIPSPSTMHFRGGRAAIDKTAYPNIDDFFSDLARVYAEEIDALGKKGCTYLQLDEVNMAYLCDDRLREQARLMGEDPNALPATYAKLINTTIANRPKSMRAGLHLCRGNSSGAWMAEGGYEPVAEILFTQIEADFYFLEYDSDRAGGFEPLRFLPKNRTAVLGLVTTKSGKMESKDELKRRIDQAAKFVPLEQLALSPQCGFSPSVTGRAMTEDEQWAKLKLIVETSREVWG